MRGNDSGPPDPDLGSLLAEHRAGSARHLSALAFVAVVSLTGGAAGAVVGYVAVSLSRRPAAAPDLAGLAAVLGLTGAVLCAASAAFLASEVRRLRWRVLVFERGFVFARGRPVAVRWTEVRELAWDKAAARVGLCGTSGPGLSVRTWSDRRVTLPPVFRDGAGLVAAIRAGVAGAYSRRKAGPA